MQASLTRLMSLIQPSRQPLQMFHRSGPAPCSYLPGQIERKLFTRLYGSDAAQMNSVLSQAGFRRSHDIVYRPVCAGCQACVPVRVLARDFVPTRTQRRIRNATERLSFAERPAKASLEDFALFAAYEQIRHAESEMALMGFEDFADMVEDGNVDSRLYALRDRGALVGAMLVDRLADGLSAVYSYYDPTRPHDSLGTVMILKLIDEARRLDLPHVYLGYWIAGSRKMAYKAGFRPIEGFGNEGWRKLE